MKRAHILVEGQTEETFVREVLTPHLMQQGIYLTSILIATKRIKAGRKFKGGIVKYSQVRKDALRLLGDSSATVVTTMIDYYGLPDDFPGYNTLPLGSCYERTEHLEHALAEDLGHSRFVPFFTLHEFETLLFVDIGAIAAAFPGQDIASSLTQIKDQFSSPEEINEGLTTHPAARILQHVKGYQKPFHGCAYCPTHRSCGHSSGMSTL